MATKEEKEQAELKKAEALAAKLAAQAVEKELKAKRDAEDAALKAQADAVAAAEKEQPGRAARWKALLENYEKRNPIKFAAKKAAGQFKEIPADFK